MTGVVTRATKGVPLTATDHDNNLEVTVSLHKSATEPSPTYACMLWADTDNDLLKMRNKANDAWITMGALDTTGAFSDNNLADQDQLSELSDVTITSVADNEVLAYDSTSSKWIIQTASEAGLATSAQGSLADSALQDGDTVSSLTITSADINGGTIDGATIGGLSAGAGTFTNLTATGTVTLGGTALTATAAELNYTDGVTSNIQTQLDAKVAKTSSTGSAVLPAGTTAERDGSPSAGYLRWNSDDTSAEVYDGSAWTAVGGGNTTDEGLYEMANTISANYTITSGNNAMSSGPITVASGVTVTVPTGSRWVIV
jgi:hypothetical protein